MPNINALVLGMNPEVSGELLTALKSCSVTPRVVDGARDLAGSLAEVIFCGPDVNLIAELRRAKPQTAIIVVSRHADVSAWLDSIEAGASDYCAAPFETAQLRWILDSSTRTRIAAAAA